MKKILLSLIGLAAGATLVHAQGNLSWVNLSADIQISTNTSYASGLSASSATGLAKTSGASAYYYAVLAATSTTANDAGNPAGSDWSVVDTFGTTTPNVGWSAGSGGVTGAGGTTPGWSSTLTAGTTYDIMVVGWSASLGSTWSAVSADFADGFAGVTSGYAGYSNVGTVDPTEAPATPASIFGGPAVQNGQLILYNLTPVPEPATLALAGLGGLSMLFLRRRKS